MTTASESELRTQTRQLCTEWGFEPTVDAWMGAADPDFSRALAKHGLLSLTWPEHLGGRGRSAVERLAITEELLRAGAPVAWHWAGERQIGPSLIKHGTPELQEEFCPRLARAEISFALGMSEPDAGSDLASVRTRAVRDGDGWRITGRKIWTSGAHHAHYLYVLARTSVEEDKHAGLSEFIVDLAAPGIEISPILSLDGEHHFNEVVLEDVHLPDHWVIGEIGAGWPQVIGQLAFERGGPERFLSMHPLLDAVLAADVLDTEGRAQLRSLAARLAVLRRWARDIALAMDADGSPVVDAATSKYVGHGFERDVLEFVRGVLPRCNAHVHLLYRQARLASPRSGLRGGAAPVMLSIIAKGTR